MSYRIRGTRRVGSAFAATLALVAVGSSVAEVWDATEQFSIEQNPNGVWSSGWTASLGAELHLFPDTDRHQFLVWVDNSIKQYGVPAFGQNVSDQTINGVPPGFLVLHGGCNAQEFAVLRWTGPADGDFQVNAQFFAGDGGNTTAAILKNSDTGDLLFSVDSTDASPTFSDVVSLVAGDTLDFIVGTAGECSSDSTPITVVISGDDRFVRGDMNCSGSDDFNDIDPFVTALISRDDYEAQYPDCNWLNGDIDESGAVDFNDIDGFVECLINGGCP